MENYLLKYYDKAETGYSSSKIPEENCFAYEYENYLIFASHENKIVKKNWITYSPTIMQEDKFPGHLVLTLLNIGNRWKVILINWNERLQTELFLVYRINSALNMIVNQY